MKPVALAATVGLAITAASLHAQDRYLMAINSSSTAPGKRIMLFSPVDGTLLNDSFIHESSHPNGWGTVKGIHQIGDYIYLSDQIRDVIYQYDLAGTYIGSLGEGHLDNIRGFDHYDGVLYISNATAVGASLANSIVKIDLAGNFLGSNFVGNSPFSVFVLGHDDMLVGHSGGSEDITRWDFNGTALGTFHAGSISYVQQITRKQSNGNFLAAGWSGSSAQGIYEIDPQGVQVNYYSVPGPRAAWELDNGNIFWTGTGFHIYDVTGGFTTQIALGTGQYVALLSLGDPACYANCDASTTEPILNVDDFTCFINEFAQAQSLPHEQQITHYANCDQSTTAPVLNVDDFTCFINAFAQGCR